MPAAAVLRATETFSVRVFISVEGWEGWGRGVVVVRRGEVYPTAPRRRNRILPRALAAGTGGVVVSRAVTDTIKILCLAVVQGLTEFLPVSSSGHLVLAQHFLGVESPGPDLELFLHVGTLLSVCAFYRRRLASLLADGFIRKLGAGRATSYAKTAR